MSSPSRSRSANCLVCGGPMRGGRERHTYDECGLAHVVLLDVEVWRCTRCDESEVVIPRIEALHRLIARALIEKSTRLTGAEVRFLRKSLGWSGTALARHMGVALETVSRWENASAPIGPQADRLLRLMVAQGRPAARYPTARLAGIDARRATVTRLEIEAREDRWELRSA